MKLVKVFILVIFVCGCASKSPEVFNLENMSNEEIISFYNELPKGGSFTGSLRVFGSAASSDDARAVLDSQYNDEYNRTNRLEMTAENDMYFLFDVGWLYMDSDYQYTETCLLFKESFYDSAVRKFGNVNEDAIKTAFEASIYEGVCNTVGSKMLESTVGREGDNYVYKCYEFYVVGGDWGLDDTLHLVLTTVTVNASSGDVVEHDETTVKKITMQGTATDSGV